jgi:hypothetical protein
VLCLFWLAYLRFEGHTLSQGKQGFIYIIVISGTILAAFAAMMLLL